MDTKDIEASMDRGDYTSNDIYGLAGILRAGKAAKRDGYERLSEDEFQRLDVIGLLLSKLEGVDPQHYTVGIGGDEWRRFGDAFSKLKRIVDSLRIEGIVDRVAFALGGTVHYHISERQAYSEYLYNQVRAILRKIIPPTEEGSTAVRSVEAIEVQEEINDLLDFKAFVERDGFKALWNDSKVCSRLKNGHQDAQSQFMAFLRGARIYTNSSQYKQVSEGAGFADVISIEKNGVKRLFELKVISSKHNRFQEGLFQLFDYICKEGLRTGYYIVFDARDPSKRDAQYEKKYLKEQKTIHIILIDIHQIAPTRKYRMQNSS